MEGASSYISEMVSTSVSVAKGSQVTFGGYFGSMCNMFSHYICVCICVTKRCPNIESKQFLPDTNGDDPAGTGDGEPLKPRSETLLVNFTHQPQHQATYMG